MSPIHSSLSSCNLKEGNTGLSGSHPHSISALPPPYPQQPFNHHPPPPSPQQYPSRVEATMMKHPESALPSQDSIRTQEPTSALISDGDHIQESLICGGKWHHQPHLSLHDLSRYHQVIISTPQREIPGLSSPWCILWCFPSRAKKISLFCYSKEVLPSRT